MFPRARFAVMCLALATVSASAMSQTACAAPGKAAGDRADVRQKLLERFDKNGNGQLDPDERDEAKAARQKLREQGGGKGQGNGRGQRQGQGKGQGLDPERRQKILARFDADGDGTLNDSEKAAAKAARAKRDQ
jgi:hypothetical protein